MAAQLHNRSGAAKSKAVRRMRFWILSSRQRVRTIEDLDHTVARNVDVRAQESMQLSAKDALVNGERLVKMNADQIHLG